MSESSPSTLFRRYTDLYYNNHESFFSELFSNCESCKSVFLVSEWRHFLEIHGFLFFLNFQCLNIMTSTTSLIGIGKA